MSDYLGGKLSGTGAGCNDDGYLIVKVRAFEMTRDPAPGSFTAHCRWMKAFLGRWAGSGTLMDTEPIPG